MNVHLTTPVSDNHPIVALRSVPKNVAELAWFASIAASLLVAQRPNNIHLANVCGEISAVCASKQS
jgi:hypothetical protein